MRESDPASEDANNVRFLLDGEVRSIASPLPTQTVLDFLREDLRRTGTKEGCAEGDCGACTVVLAELDGAGRLRSRAVNSCIQFLPTLDGKALFTVESLKSAAGLHPVQQAMADGHGSQCGFCTPGFVMSLFALYKNDPAPDRKCIDDALSGNLCRCTGYRPIVDAARNMYELGRALPDDVLSWLSAPAGRSCPRAVTDEGELVRTLEGLRRGRALRIKHAGGAFHAPRTLDELAALRAELPNARLLAGGTDIGLWVTKQLRRIDEIIYVGEVAELHRIVRTDTDLEIGAAATLSEASGALIADFPGIEAVLRRYASPPIRNAATIGGNIANGSPIGDSMPCLLALGARIALRSVGVRREMALEDFYLGYQKTALGADEFVEKILIPLPAAGQAFRAYKVSKRFDQDISVVCAAFCLTLSEGRVRAARIAFGGMAAVPQRAAHCEAALVGMSWSVDAALQASTALSVDFSPIDDMRGTAAYRMQVARNLLTRFYVEISDPGQATRVDSLELPVS